MSTSIAPFTITFRPDLSILVIRWQREISQAELQHGYAVVLQAALEHQAACWLVDSRRRTQSDAEMVDWLATSFLPSLHEKLKKTVRLACLTAASWQQPKTQNTPLAILAQRTTATLNQGFQVQLFGDEGAAVSWLQEHC